MFDSGVFTHAVDLPCIALVTSSSGSMTPLPSISTPILKTASIGENISIQLFKVALTDPRDRTNPDLSGSTITNSWVDPGIDQIHHQIHDNKDRDNHHHKGLRQGVIMLQHGIDK